MVTTTQLQNYKNIRRLLRKVMYEGHLLKSTILRITRSCHSALKRVRMIVNHPILSNVRLVIFQRIEFVLGLRNRALLDITMFKNSGIPIHGR